MTLTPRDPDFRSRVRSSFGRQRAMRTLAVDLLRVEPGSVELAMPFAEAFTQQHGFVHAGIITTVLDSACGYAAYTLMAPGTAVLTVEFKTNLLAPARGERFLVRGEVLKPGRTLTIAEGRAFAVADDAEKLVASMTGTLMAVTERDDVQC